MQGFQGVFLAFLPSRPSKIALALYPSITNQINVAISLRRASLQRASFGRPGHVLCKVRLWFDWLEERALGWRVYVVCVGEITSLDRTCRFEDEALSQRWEKNILCLPGPFCQVRASHCWPFHADLTHAKTKRCCPFQEAGAPKRIERERGGKMGGD